MTILPHTLDLYTAHGRWFGEVDISGWEGVDGLDYDAVVKGQMNSDKTWEYHSVRIRCVQVCPFGSKEPAVFESPYFGVAGERIWSEELAEFFAKAWRNRQQAEAEKMAGVE
jgi:hypothetical protein